MTMAHIIPYPQPACLLLLEPRWKLVPSPSWLRFMEDSVKIKGLTGTEKPQQPARSPFVAKLQSMDSSARQRNCTWGPLRFGPICQGFMTIDLCMIWSQAW